MTVLNGLAGRTPQYWLLVALTAALYVLVMLLSPLQPMQRHAAALLGIWLCIASLIRYLALRTESSREPIRWIPVRFSGDLGRFELRPRGDGRRVEIRAGSEIVAEAIASDEGDELVLDFEAIGDAELEAFGAAIGQAIEMVAAADEDRPEERQVAGPASWGKAPEGFEEASFVGSDGGPLEAECRAQPTYRATMQPGWDPSGLTAGHPAGVRLPPARCHREGMRCPHARRAGCQRRMPTVQLASTPPWRQQFP